jgi:hypothetical protein
VQYRALFITIIVIVMSDKINCLAVERLDRSNEAVLQDVGGLLCIVVKFARQSLASQLVVLQVTCKVIPVFVLFNFNGVGSS